MTTLRDQLYAQGYLATESLVRQVEAALHTKPTAGAFLTGPAGAGKTFLAEAVALVQERTAHFFQAFPGCRKEELFQTIHPDASAPSGFRTLPGVLPQAAEGSLTGPTALILDEWDKTHPSTDAFLLDFLQNGRISIPGAQLRADQKQLLVFITLNDERELSEPLLRRLPLIELRPNPPELVLQALRDTHPDHPMLPAALALYQRSLLVSLTKPVTIQELRQLLDAITVLGQRSDWNQLVYQFVTKNWDDHELLKSAESLATDADPIHLQRERAVLDPQAYSGAGLRAGGGEGAETAMPRVERDWLERMPAAPLSVTDAQVYGVVPRTESGYDGVARALLQRSDPEGGSTGTDDPADLAFAKVGDAEIIVFEALNFEQREQWGLVLKDGAELLLQAKHHGEISPQMLLDFKAGTLAQHPEDPDRCRIYSLSNSEVLMRYKALKVRWTRDLLEVVTHDFAATQELWEHLYGGFGVVTANRRALEALEPGTAPMGTGGSAPRAPLPLEDNEQLRTDYLSILRDYRHLREWLGLCITRNLRIWHRVTCSYRNHTVTGAALEVSEFNPNEEAPASKAQAEAIALYHSLTRPALDYYESHLQLIETELVQFVAKNGELPVAVEDGGIFGLHEVHTDLDKLKREGLKLYMRKTPTEI